MSELWLGIAIGLTIGAVVALIVNGIWYRFVRRVNREWYEYADELSEGWYQFTMKIVRGEEP